MEAVLELASVAEDQLVDALVDLIGSVDGSKIGMIVELLSEIGSEKAIEGLIRCMRSVKVLTSARSKLVSMPDRALGPLLSELRKSDESARTLAGDTLIGMVGAAEPLCRLIKDDNPDARFEAVRVLGEMKKTETLEPLLHRLGTRAYFPVREHQEGGLPEPVDVDVEDEARVRWALVRAVGKIGHTRGAARLRERLSNDSHGNVRGEAAYSLVAIVANQSSLDRTTVRLLVRTTQTDSSPEVRDWARDALLRLGPRLADELKELLSDVDSYTRAGAAEALGRIKSAPALTALRVALRDKDEDVRLKAIQAIELVEAESKKPPAPDQSK